MNHIDRLLIKAKKISGYNGKQLVLAMVVRCGDSWKATARLWNRVQGYSETVDTGLYATLDAAEEYIHALAQEYPNSYDVAIIIDDLE